MNNRQLLKILWEKKKLLVTSNFFFSHKVFYSKSCSPVSQYLVHHSFICCWIGKKNPKIGMWGKGLMKTVQDHNGIISPAPRQRGWSFRRTNTRKYWCITSMAPQISCFWNTAHYSGVRTSQKNHYDDKEFYKILNRCTELVNCDL